MNTRRVLDVDVTVTDYDEATAHILPLARARTGAAVDHLSVHGLVLASSDAAFRAALARCAMVLPDGQPVRWALGWLHGIHLADRVYGPELMQRLCAAAAREGIGVFLYGGTDDVLAKLSAALRASHPGLRIAGMHAPPFRELTAGEDRDVVQRINDSGAGLVFIGIGCPKQEFFAAAHVDRIHAVQLCVGAAFDFLAGVKPMAPRVMQRAGLEWLFRLATEPRRLFARYAISNTRFVWLMARALLARR